MIVPGVEEPVIEPEAWIEMDEFRPLVTGLFLFSGVGHWILLGMS